MADLQSSVNRLWYQKNNLYYLLIPFSWIFYLIIVIRKAIYLYLYRQKKFSVPIIIVGNITVGGTGKTPMVIYLAEHFKKNGYKPGVSIRGYKSNISETTRVQKHHTANEVGDEALMIAQRTRVPVMAGTDRLKNIDKLINDTHCNIVICDDGLQDYRFKHDLEIAMVDGERIFGNQNLLPAGPLREPIERLHAVDCIVSSQKALPNIDSHIMQIEFDCIFKLNNEDSRGELVGWKGKTIHAVAGIGNPERFFIMLEQVGINVIRHPFDDHAEYKSSDFFFKNKYPIVMTEKDAVKCKDLKIDNAWYLPVNARLKDEFTDFLCEKIRGLNG